MIFTPHNRRAAAGNSGTTHVIPGFEAHVQQKMFQHVAGVSTYKVLVCIWMVGTCLLFSSHLLLFAVFCIFSIWMYQPTSLFLAL